MKIRCYLLPFGFKLPGIVLLLAGILLLVARYQFNYKPEFLNMKVFAVYTYVIKSQSFAMITNQMAEEIGGIFLLGGLFLIAFTEEKNENKSLEALRLQAFMLMAYLNIIFLFLSILFFYGFGFVGAVTGFIVFWLIGYITVFRYLVVKSKS